METKKQSSPVFVRAPIVAVLGHVDHGKTTLLDFIRSSRIADSEAGHITQSIGAYQVEVKSPASPAGRQKLTFIDTPGHEAFAKIRSRGTSVADVAILVVAADDGVMPQTIESIKRIKEAQISFVVAINKIDVEGSDPKRVKQQLAQHEVLVEGFGGDVVTVEISAKTGQNVTQLLEMVILLAQMQGLPGLPTDPFAAVVIDTTRDAHKGVIVDIIVKSGTIAIGDTVFAEEQEAKVRALFNDQRKTVSRVVAGMPAELLGFKDVPPVGARITTTKRQAPAAQQTAGTTSLEDRLSLFLSQENKGLLKIILRADTAGSLEAVREHLPPEVTVIAAGTGDITKSDVTQARAGSAVIIGFNSSAPSSVIKEATQEGVRFKTYAVIYELLEEITDVVELLKNPDAKEEDVGKATIVTEFPFENTRIAGCKVIEGRLVAGDTVRLLRGTTLLATTKIRSIQQGKIKVDKVTEGDECGILLDKKLDFRPEDAIIAYKIKAAL